jgi:hypothetical protein
MRDAGRTKQVSPRESRNSQWWHAHLARGSTAGRRVAIKCLVISLFLETRNLGFQVVHLALEIRDAL